MDAIIEMFVTYGPYLGLALGINAIMIGLKTKVAPDFFKNGLGTKFLWAIPLVLGLVGGLLLGTESVKAGLLTGLGIGAVSHYFYKFVTKILRVKKDEISKEDPDLG